MLEVTFISYGFDCLNWIFFDNGAGFGSNRKCVFDFGEMGI
jgi:hypothetical protein